MENPIRIIKLNANESGPFTQTGTKTMNFDVPADLGVVDLDRSYVLFKMSNTATHTDASHAPATEPVAIAGGDSTVPPYDSDCLVRNSYFHSERAGRLEDGNDINILNQPLNFYGKSSQELQADTVYNGAFQYDEYKKPHSAFRDLRYAQNGTTVTYAGKTSTELEPEIRVPLPKVAKIADGMREFPIMSTGDCRLHLEIQDSAVPLMHTYEDSDVYVTLPMDVSSSTSASRKTATLVNRHIDAESCKLWCGAPITLAYNTVTASGGLEVTADSGDLTWSVDISNADFNLDNDEITISGTDLTAVSPANTAAVQGLTLVAKFTNPVASDSNPYGQTKLDFDVCVGSAGLNPGDQFTWSFTSDNIGAVTVTNTVVDTDAVKSVKSHKSYITSLAHDASNGEITVGFNDPLARVAGARTTFGSLSIPQPASSTWEISDANLVVHQHLLSPEQKEKLQKNLDAGVDIPYMVWDTERANVNSGETKFTQQFRLPPMCGNVLMSKVVGDSLVNKTDTMTKHRLEINGVQTTDRDVETREPLYHDKFIECWSNMNKPLKNLDERYSLDTNESAYANEPALICQTVPLMEDTAILDAVVDGTNMSSGNMYVYKQKQRVLKLSGQRAEVQN